ncbi:uncharacterized protein (DUF697 family) [Micrococcus aloeverae]
MVREIRPLKSSVPVKTSGVGVYAVPMTQSTGGAIGESEFLSEDVEPVQAEEIHDAEAELGKDLGAPKDASEEEKAEVEGELGRLRGIIQGLSLHDLKTGDWFLTLLRLGVATHARQVDAAYFRRKYPHLSPDAIADARIQLASRYAAIAGGLTASAYTGALAATAGSGGAASPLTMPAALTSFSLDLAYSTQTQLRLAYDMSVIYGIPLDMDDSEDVWKLIRLAFGIRAGEVASNAALKGMPMVVRPLVKKIFSGSTLKAVKSIPQVGGLLLQRNIVKFSIPGISIPVSTAVNYWATRASGKYAQGVFRTEAVIIERARRVAASTPHHAALLRVVILVTSSDGKTSEAERLLLHHLSLVVDNSAVTVAVLDEQREAIEVDVPAVWAAVEDITVEDRAPLHAAAEWAAGIDGKIKGPAKEIVARLAALAQVDDRQGKDEPEEQSGETLRQRSAGIAKRSIGAVGRIGRGLQEKRNARTVAEAEADEIARRSSSGADAETE